MQKINIGKRLLKVEINIIAIADMLIAFDGFFKNMLIPNKIIFIERNNLINTGMKLLKISCSENNKVKLEYTNPRMMNSLFFNLYLKIIKTKNDDKECIASIKIKSSIPLSGLLK